MTPRRSPVCSARSPLAPLIAIALWMGPAGAGCSSEGEALLGPPASSTRPATVGRVGDGTLTAQLEAIRGDHRLPALAAVTFGPDGVLESGFSGVRALGHAEVIAAADRWHIGSLTKSMTATLAAIVIEQGRVGWQTTIPEVFRNSLPDIPNRAEYQMVTLTELLTHTSGMGGNLSRAASWGASLLNGTQSLREQRSRLTKELLALPPETERGVFSYSNAGYVVAGAMLERVMDEPWEGLMARLLFEPLGLSSAGFGPPAGAGPLDEPWGHFEVGGGFRAAPPGPTSDNPLAIGPAGTVHANLSDLVSYYRMHLKGGAGGNDLISEASLTMLHRPAAGASYSPGWGVIERSWAGGVALQHIGSNNFWYATVWLAPARGFGVLTLSNCGGTRATAASEDAAVMLITRFNGEPPT